MDKSSSEENVEKPESKISFQNALIKHEDELEVSNWVRIPIVFIVLLILGDIYAILTTIRDFEGYAILIIPVMQIYFLPPIFGLALLYNSLRDRELRIQLEEIYQTTYQKGFIDKIVSSPHRKKVLAIFLVILISTSMIGSVAIFQDQHEEIITFEDKITEDLSLGYIFEVDVSPNSITVIAEYFADKMGLAMITLSNSYEIVDFQTFLSGDEVAIIDIYLHDDTVFVLRESNYFDSGTHTANYSLISVDLQSLEVNTIYSWQVNPDLFQREYFWNYIEVIEDNPIIIRSKQENGVLSSSIFTFIGNITTFEIDRAIHDVEYFNNELFVVSTDGENLYLDNLNPDTLSITSSLFSSQLQLPESEEIGIIPEQENFGSCATLFRSDETIYLRTLNNLYSITEDNWSDDPEHLDFCYSNFISGPKKLEGNLVLDDLIVLGYDQHLTYYSKSLEQLTMVHAPNSGFSLLPSATLDTLNVDSDDIIVSIDQTSRIYLWSTNIEKIRTGVALRNIFLYSGIIIFITSVLYLIIIVRKIHQSD